MALGPGTGNITGWNSERLRFVTIRSKRRTTTPCNQELYRFGRRELLDSRKPLEPCFGYCMRRHLLVGCLELRAKEKIKQF